MKTKNRGGENEMIVLPYVGYTSSSSVKGREILDGYEENRLMSSLWKVKKPFTFVAFKTPSDSGVAGDVLQLMEFLIVEMLGTFGTCGFNKQPGGAFTYTAKNWVSYEKM